MEWYRFKSPLSEVWTASESAFPGYALRKTCEIHTLWKLTNVLIGHVTEILQISIGLNLCFKIWNLPLPSISVTLFRKFPSENPSMCLSIFSMRIEATQGHLLYVTNAMCHPDAKVSIVNLCQAKNLCLVNEIMVCFTQLPSQT